jgi:hypothetical protein
VVSFFEFVVVFVINHQSFRERSRPKKTHRQVDLAVGLMSAYLKKIFLGQQPPRARAHASTTTTTDAAAHRAEFGAT